MQLTLKNFDTVEDKDATERGLKYYRDGAVSYIEETEEGEWEASVMGTELYSVGISLRKEKINAIGCECEAFAQNDYCKHIAAVLYAIRDQQAKVASVKTKEKKQKPKTAIQLLQEVLKSTSEKQLKNFIEGYAEQHKDFAKEALLHLKMQDVVNDASEEGFIEVVQTALANSRNKNGVDTELLDSHLKPVIRQAHKYVTDGNYLETLHIVKAIISVLLPVLNEFSYTFRHDENPVIQSIWLLESISGFSVPPMFRDELFGYCLDLSRQKEFIDNDYDQRIDELLLRLASDSYQREEIIQLIREKLVLIIPTGATFVNGTRLRKHLAYVQYELKLLHDMGRDADVDQAMRDHLYYHDELRQEQIRRAIEHQDAAYARQLVDEKLAGKSVKTDSYYNHEREKLKWSQYYLDIAILENNTADILSLSESLFKNNYEIRFYNILKEYYPEDKWHRKFEELESALFRKHYSFGILALIYIQEGKTKDLFELVKRHAFLGNLHDTLPYLLPGYKNEILMLYHKALISLLNHATVSSYKEAVEHLEYLLSLGLKDTVHDWIETFKSIYSNRPRFLKELGKLQV